jgi:GINS complex subunit 4
VRHWLNERHAPDILPVQAEVLGALLDHIRRQVRQFYFSLPGIVRK